MNARRICQINFADRHSGAERIGLTLHQGFRRRGRDARLHVGAQRTDEPGVRLIDNDAHRSAWARRWHALGERLTQGGRPRLGKAACAVGRPIWAWRRLRGRDDHNQPATRELIDTLRREPPHVVHAHNLHGGYFDLRQLPALCQIAPVVLTMHDAWLTLDGPAYANLAPPPRRSPYNLALKRAIFQRCRLRIAAPCQWLLDEARESVLAPALIETRRVPYGVDTRVFRPMPAEQTRAALALDADEYVVLFVGHTGRANPAKDFATVRAAVRQASEAMPERRWALLVLGEQAPDEPLGRARVQYLGNESDPERIAGVYAAADVLAHAAHADTFPVVVLEALACGRPVVATRIGGIGEQISDGRTGHLVPPADAAAMCEALIALARDPDRRAAMGIAARAEAERCFDLERMVDDYLAWFDRITSPEAR